MKFTPVLRIGVVLDIEGEARRLGDLAWSREERLTYFQYSADYLKAPLPLSPFHLPPKSEALAAKREPFEGLHGLFNDSLPDGWGRLLLDRRLQKHGIDHLALTPLDRLAAVGQNGMGALRYEPALEGPDQAGLDDSLDWYADEILKVQAELEVAEIDRLQGVQGGSAGARPKIMIGLSPDGERLVAHYGQPLADGYAPWLVKFRSQNDPADIGPEEHAYALMAAAAGVEMSETRVLSTQKGNHLFATKRFDRTPQGCRHVHTVSGLVYADHRYPALDYTDILKVTAMVTRDHTQVVQMFRRMVFNVLSRNRDDHAKNHALIMNKAGQWRLSPAYDLTCSQGPGGEHSTTIAGEGAAPELSHMLEVARRASIHQKEARAEIERVRAAIDGWRGFADQAELPKKRALELETILKKLPQ